MADVRLLKKKIVVLCAALATFAAMSATAPMLPVRHGIPAVWVVLPMVGPEVVGFVYVMLLMKTLRELTSSA